MKTTYVIRLAHWRNRFVGKSKATYAIQSDQAIAEKIVSRGFKQPTNQLEKLKLWEEVVSPDAHWFAPLEKARIYTSIASVRRIFALYNKAEPGVVLTFNQYEIVELQVVQGRIDNATSFLNDTKPQKQSKKSV